MYNFITMFDKSREELEQMRLCISCSCGKDSIAVAIICHEKKIPIHSIIRFNNFSDWSCMDVEWERLKTLYSDTSTKFIVFDGTPLLDLICQKHKYRIFDTDQFGYVPCGPYNRFGTIEKQTILNSYISDNKLTSVIGIAFGENRKLMQHVCYPLVELRIVEASALQICYDNGFLWEQLTDYGFSIRLYDFCNRLSCKYCGFCNSDQLALIVALFPSEYKVFCDIQLRLDVPFKYWSSAFNFPDKLKNKVYLIKKRCGLVV